MMKVYFGNLPMDMTDAQLSALVAPHGKTDSVVIVKDRATGGSKGFGFVEFGNDAEAKAAIAGLDGKDVGGRALKVNEARPQKPVGSR
jgi:cold-inducible RNA-binding protein